MDKRRNTVAVTGIAGFLASHIAKRLLEEGYRVRGSVRSLRKEASYAHLLRLEGAKERLELVEADLLAPEGFPKVVEGAHYVLHTASPYTLNVEDPERDLVRPAVDGTRNVLEACTSSSSVERVVVTSSMAAITDEPESTRVLTEDDWNESSSLRRNPYYYSKTLAERAAWDFVGARRPSWDLVVVNPFLVIGPSLSPGINTSNQMFVDLLAGQYPGIMNLTWGFVDVRDAAEAHVRAMTTTEAKGRYICAGETISMRDVVSLMTEDAQKHARKSSLPKLGLDCAAGDFAVKVASYGQPGGVGQYLRSHVGRVPRYDTSKIRRDLGMTFRPARESILDSIADLARAGHLPA